MEFFFIEAKIYKICCNKNLSASKSPLMALWLLKAILMDFGDFSYRLFLASQQGNDIYWENAIGKYMCCAVNKCICPRMAVVYMNDAAKRRLCEFSLPLSTTALQMPNCLNVIKKRTIHIQMAPMENHSCSSCIVALTKN